MEEHNTRLTRYTNDSCINAFFKSESNLAMTITFIENIIAMAVLFTVKTKSSNTHFLIKLMASNDLLCAFGVLCSSIAATTYCETFIKSLACDLIGWVATSAFCWSLHLVVVMNIERYFMVCHPVIHRNHFSKKLLVLLCGIGLVVSIVVMGLPLVGVGDTFDFYEKNKVCAFNLAPGSHPTQRVLVGYCGCQGLVWVSTTLICSIRMSRKLGKRSRVQVADATCVEDADKQRSKRKVLCCYKEVHTKQKPSRFAFVLKVIAFVNCAMNLPFYVSTWYFLIENVNLIFDFISFIYLLQT